MGTFSNKRIECPKCGARRGFAPFVDADGGYCHACGYSNINNIQNQVKYIGPPPFCSEPEKTKTLPYNYLNRFKDYSHSNFSKYFTKLFGPDFALNCKNIFLLKSDKFGALIFPFIDFHGRLRTLKTIPYNLDGHRDKEGIKVNFKGEITNYPSFFGYRYDRQEGFDKIKGFGKNKGYTQCLYNEIFLNPHHQPLNYDMQLEYSSNTPVILVEAEKTVVICTYFFPQFIFIASGGLSGLTEVKAKALCNRNVHVCFDNEPKAQDRALKAVNQLLKAGAKAEVFDLFKGYDVPEGYDMADAVEYLYRKGKLKPWSEDS